MRTVRLTLPGRVRLDPTDDQAVALTAAVSVLTAAPASPIPEIPPGEYRWTSDGIMFVDVEASASTGRVIMEAAGFGHRALPLPYQANLDTTAFGHDGAENVGRIDTLTLNDGAVAASGFLTVSDDGEGREYVLAVALGNVPGVSVDAAVLEHTMVYETDEAGMVVDAVCRAHRWEIMGVTGTPFPAFADARVSVEGVDTAQAFDAAETDDDEDMGDEAEMGDDTSEDEADAPAMAASAAGGPPAWWFEDPQLDRPTPLTVDDDGRVYGHIAPWEQAGRQVCHVGFSDRCVCPPKSPDGAYPYMMSGGTVLCADGTRAQVATIAYLGGHPDDDGTQPWTTIKAAYDDPANAGLQVAVGEDRHGVWLAGRVAPTRTPAEVEVIRACGVSGHWRNKIQGDPHPGPRMIGACCVLSEGFPKSVLTAAADSDDLPPTVSGPRARYEGDDLVSLVAATGTAQLAAAHKPATLADVAVLADDVEALRAELSAARVRLSLLDPQVREAAASAFG